MADVFVYTPNCEDFDNIGEAGSLTPTSCVHSELANGMSEIELVHPIDEMGKWSYLQQDYIISAEVPVRTLPEIVDGVLVTSLERWNVYNGASKNERRLFSKSTGGKVLTRLKPGQSVIVTRKGSSRYKCKTGKRTGWIAISALENKVDVTVPATAAGIEQAMPAWTFRPQLFRIYKVEKSDTSVTVLAKHWFYNHAQNITSYSADNPTCVQALAGLISGCVADNDLEGSTNISGTRVGIKWDRVPFVDALLNPDTGLIKLWGAEIVRDNGEFCVLAKAGLDRGVRVEYGKNLKGVELALDYSDLVTRYVPLGQTSKGKVLTLAAGTYTTDHGTIIIPSGQTWIDAPNIGDYPTPHIETLDTGVKAGSTSSASVKDAREKMIDAALNKFEDEQTNYPKVTLTVDFVQIGDTEEYAQYRQLDNMFLYDTVRVRHPKIGIDLQTEVTEYVWDCLNNRASKITLGNVQPQNVGKRLPSWQLPSGIPGTLVAPGTLSSYALDDSVGTDIDLIKNETVAAVAQQYVRNAWITGGQVFRYAAGSLTPDPASIVVTANLQNVLMDRWQYQDSNGAWQDYPVGDGNASNTATTLVVKPSHAVWANNICTLRMLTTDPAISDTYNLYKVADGATGATGATGAPGQNASVAFLTNENVTFAGNASGQVTATSVVCNVVAYTGTSKVAPMVGTITGMPAGMTVTKGAAVNGEIPITITIEGNATLGGTGPVSGALSVPITAPVNITLTITWSKVNTGANGAAGANAKTCWVSGEQVFKYAAGESTPVPAQITLTANVQNVAFAKWQYKNGSGAWVDITGATNVNYTVLPTGSHWNGNLATYRAVTADATVYDIMTVYKVSDGATGAAGVSIAAVDVEYYLSTSATALAGGTWSTTAPAWADGKYIWSRTKTTYSSGSPTYTNPACITGSAGSTGATGAAGKGVTSIVEEYYLSTSNTMQTGGSWVTTPPAWVNGKYMWTRSTITYTDAATTVTTPACVTGAAGSTGPAGANGSDGLNGLTAILSNAAHTLPKTTGGAIDYTGSGTTLRLFEGATELDYLGIGTDFTGVTAGAWKAGRSPSGITPGIATQTGSAAPHYATYSDVTAIAGNRASIPYTIYGKRLNGTQFTLTVIQTFSVAQQGATGGNAVVFGVYGLSGTTFVNQTGSLVLSAIGYDGANQITSGAIYAWYKYAAGSWTAISGQIGSTLTVTGADVVGLQAYRCDMTYGGKTYSGTITLTDKTDNYQATIESSGGDTFRNGVGSSILVCKLWQAGTETDALKSSVISQTAPSSPTMGAYYYKINPSTPQVALMRWNGSLWQDVTANPTYAHAKSYTWYRRDKDGNPMDGGTAFATGKVIYVDGDDVDQQTTWTCEVS